MYHLCGCFINLFLIISFIRRRGNEIMRDTHRIFREQFNRNVFYMWTVAGGTAGLFGGPAAPALNVVGAIAGGGGYAASVYLEAQQEAVSQYRSRHQNCDKTKNTGMCYNHK